MKITLEKAKITARHEDGSPLAWKHQEVISTFLTAKEALDYVETNLNDLPEECVFFTGSSSLLNQLNTFLHEKLTSRKAQHVGN